MTTHSIIHQTELILSREMTFYTLGNPRVLGDRFGKPTGFLPNLPAHLRENHQHPHDHFKVVRLIVRRESMGRLVSIYQIDPSQGHGANVMFEIITETEAIYGTAQYDDIAEAYELQLLTGGDDDTR
jgi:hypothetical protein